MPNTYFKHKSSRSGINTGSRAAGRQGSGKGKKKFSDPKGAAESHLNKILIKISLIKQK
jgi:hypothetical protein